ncbi:MAG: glycosyltransferase family 4 protein [Microgenomates group bacterium]
MKILMVIERFFPLIGGSETQCYQLSEKFVSFGGDVSVVTKRWKKELPLFEKFKEGFSVFRIGIPGSGRIADYFGGLALFFFLFRFRHSFDLIYVNGGLANIFGSTAILAGKLLRKPVGGKVATPGELIFSGPKALAPKEIVHPLIKIRLWIAKTADFYTAHTPEVVRELQQLGIKKEKIKEFTNSVDEKLFKPTTSEEKKKIRQALNLPLNKVIVIFCGRLVKRKGLAYLFEAWRDLEEIEPNSILFIIGSGENQPDSVEDKLKKFIKKNGIKNIKFLGSKKREEVAKFLKVGDIFVYPSVHPEGTALSVLEAMSCGMAVVGTDIGGINKMVKSGVNGLLVKKKNHQNLLKAILFLIKNPQERSRLGKRAREEILEKYTNDKVAKMYFNFFQNLVYKKQQ